MKCQHAEVVDGAAFVDGAELAEQLAFLAERAGDLDAIGQPLNSDGAAVGRIGCELVRLAASRESLIAFGRAQQTSLGVLLVLANVDIGGSCVSGRPTCRQYSLMKVAGRAWAARTAVSSSPHSVPQK